MINYTNKILFLVPLTCWTALSFTICDLLIIFIAYICLSCIEHTCITFPKAHRAIISITYILKIKILNQFGLFFFTSKSASVIFPLIENSGRKSASCP